MPTDPVFIGIDPTGGRRPFHYAVLDRRLRPLLEGQGALDAVAQAVADFPEAACAVDAPMLPNAGQMAQPETRRRFGLAVHKATWAQYKVCEYELRRRGIRLYNTPAAPERVPGWMRLGWVLYARLREAGFVEYRPGQARAPRQMLEVHPHACFTVLLGRIPLKKDTLEGRVQRQLVLYREGLDLPDAMQVFEEITRHHLLSGRLELNGLRSHDQLDALAAAHTAYLVATRPERVTAVGDETEGYIVVPGTLGDRYT